MYHVAKSVFVSFIAPLLLSQFFGHASAQTDQVVAESDAEQALIEKWYKVYDEICENINLSHGPTNSKSTQITVNSDLKRHTLLALKTEASTRHGKAYLWTDKGSPIIFGVIASGMDTQVQGARYVAVRLNSLTHEAVASSRFDQVFWKCEQPGVHWKKESTHLVPSDNRATRLIQLKTIVRQFTATGITQTANHEYRLMPQPIYRYPDITPGVTDGAIFAFSRGTDPNAILQIEARQDGWYLACSRNAPHELKILKGDEVIWSFDKQERKDRFQTEPFYFKYTTERRVADDPSKVLFSNWESR